MKSAKVALDAGICERLVAPAELDNDDSFQVIAGTLDDLLDAFGLSLDTRGDRSEEEVVAWRGWVLQVLQRRSPTSHKGGGEPARRSPRGPGAAGPNPSTRSVGGRDPVNPDIEGVGLIRVTSLGGIAEGQADASIHDLRRPKPSRTRPTTGRLRSPARARHETD
jgi:hypothetical protein